MSKLTAFLFGPNKHEKFTAGEPPAYASHIAYESEQQAPPASESAPEPPLWASAKYEPEQWEWSNISDREQHRRPQVLSGDDVFVWRTSKGENVPVSLMATPHLFYAMRKVFNHSVAPAFRVGDFKRANELFTWPTEYRMQAVQEMLIELSRRADADQEYKDQVDDVLMNMQFMCLGDKPLPKFDDPRPVAPRVKRAKKRRIKVGKRKRVRR